jgi:hypothetical protein
MSTFGRIRSDQIHNNPPLCRGRADPIGSILIPEAPAGTELDQMARGLPGREERSGHVGRGELKKRQRRRVREE